MLGSFTARTPRHPALRPWVQTVWAVEREATGWEARLPTGRAQLVVNQHADRLTWQDRDGVHAAEGAGLADAGAGALAITAVEQRACVGAAFTPAGRAAFDWWAGAPGAVGIRDVGRLEPAALERLRVVRGDAALDALEVLLLAHLAAPPPRWLGRVVARLELPGARVRTIADDLSLSQRRLSRTFTAATGLRPKAFARVRRLQRAVGLLGGPRELGEVAFAAGYADQAHFNHDVADLVGLTPSELRAGLGPWRTHVQLPPSGTRSSGR